MAGAATDDGLTRCQRYRRRQREKGMKLVRVWVPDPSAPSFRAAAMRQAALLRGAEEELEALRFIDLAVEWPDP